MENRWSDLKIRVYSSNLLGADENLVLAGGGNTSVKYEDILYVKGSGWSLADIKEEGFAPVKLQALLDMVKRETLSDSEMVRLQREAMTNKDAPNPSVEAILHAIIPFKYVDHTHADAVVTISNSKRGKEIIDELYSDFLIIPYVMPGFVLAKEVYEISKNIDWQKINGIILHNHGIFTFSDSAKKSYSKMIEAVNRAEEYLEEKAKIEIEKQKITKNYDLEELKRVLSKEKGYEVTLKVDNSDLAIFYSNQENLKEFVSRGVLTPEHIIRTKREPLVLENDDFEQKIEEYKREYEKYFKTFAKDEVMLNPAPNYIVAKGFGVISIGKNEKEAELISQIVSHTMMAVLRADKLGGYESISLKDSFDMEYWELEQAKLKAK